MNFTAIGRSLIDALPLHLKDTPEDRAAICLALASVLYTTAAADGDKVEKTNAAVNHVLEAARLAKGPKPVERLPLMFHVGRHYQGVQEVHTIRFKEGAATWNATCGKIIDADWTQGEPQDEPLQITCADCLKAYTERFTWTVQFTVHPTWVADGFNLDDDRAFEMLCRDLSFANSDELEAKVLIAPDADEIAMEQGYHNAEHMRTGKC